MFRKMLKHFNHKERAFIVLLILCSFSARAQKVISENELDLYKDSLHTISVEEVEVNPDGTYTLYAFSQEERNGSFQETEVEKAQAKVSSCIILQLDSNLRLLNPAKESFITTEQQSGMPVKEDTIFLPAWMTQKAAEHDYSVAHQLGGKPVISHTSTHFTFDTVNYHLKERKREEKIVVEVPAMPIGSLYLHEKVRIGKKSGLLSMVAGEKLETDSLNLSHYQQQIIVNTTLEGKIIRQHPLSFDFPMELRLHQFVNDQEGGAAGIVYVFGAARRFGRKGASPEPTLYQIVVLDASGQKRFQHSYRYGTSKNTSEPIYAAVKGDSLYVLGKGVGRNPDYHLLLFDQTGLKKQVLINPDLLFEKTRGDYRKALSYGYAGNFKPAGFRFSEEGGIVFYGEHQYMVTPESIHPESQELLPAKYRYNSFAFLCFDKEGNFSRNEVVPKRSGTDINREAGIRFLSDREGRLCFLLREPGLTESRPMDDEPFDQTNGRRVMKSSEVVETFSVFSLPLDSSKAGFICFQDYFIAPGDDGLQKYCEEKGELLLIGRSPEQNSAGKILLKRIKF